MFLWRGHGELEGGHTSCSLCVREPRRLLGLSHTGQERGALCHFLFPANNSSPHLLAIFRSPAASRHSMPFHLTHNPLWEKHYHFRLHTGHWVEKWSNTCKVAQLAKGRAKVHTQLWLMAKPYPLPHTLLPFPVAAGSGTDQSFGRRVVLPHNPSCNYIYTIWFLKYDINKSKQDICTHYVLCTGTYGEARVAICPPRRASPILLI